MAAPMCERWFGIVLTAGAHGKRIHNQLSTCRTPRAGTAESVPTHSKSNLDQVLEISSQADRATVSIWSPASRVWIVVFTSSLATSRTVARAHTDSWGYQLGSTS
ncbi:hypothetical protein J6590_013417 [Homalodisca vitripennis]|nr:hypothetical protein J6590_013417 [Homalodisca vitripennis]